MSLTWVTMFTISIVSSIMLYFPGVRYAHWFQSTRREVSHLTTIQRTMMTFPGCPSGCGCWKICALAYKMARRLSFSECNCLKSYGMFSIKTLVEFTVSFNFLWNVNFAQSRDFITNIAKNHLPLK